LKLHNKRNKQRALHSINSKSGVALNDSTSSASTRLTDTSSPLMALACAALALPGLSMLSTNAHAENAPENGLIAFKYLRYQDSQPGLTRITVDAPSVYLLAPVAGGWSVEASAVLDTLSGATPRAYSSKSSATGYPSGKGMYDRRVAGDIKVTKYFSRAAISLGTSQGNENDYRSNSWSVDGRWSTENNNTTLNAGYGYSLDKVDTYKTSGSGTVIGKKRVDDLIIGITQVLSPNDIVQANLSFSKGSSKDMQAANESTPAAVSVYSDGYKLFDQRPPTREATVLLGRWNHHFTGADASLRTTYRYYRDTFKVSSHTLGAEWAQPVNDKFTLTPGLRYFSQSAASFYKDPDPLCTLGQSLGCAPLEVATNAGDPAYYSSVDHRLSAFGAITLGLKASYKITKEWTVDGKAEYYQQRSNWRFGGKGSPGLDTFSANFFQVGIARSF
jgi:Protein of unknown function (DUF3570)